MASKHYDMRRGSVISRSYKRERLAAFVVEQRRVKPMMKYEDLHALLLKRFKCGKDAASTAITDGTNDLRDSFNKFAADAPRQIIDGYLMIFDEAMASKNLTAARRTLDSMRDMFGLRSAINVNVYQTSGDIPDDAYDALSDEQLEALAKLDQVSTKMPIIDVAPIADAVEAAEGALADVEDTSDALDDVAPADYGDTSDDEPELEEEEEEPE